jgi:hypothetical protein
VDNAAISKTMGLERMLELTKYNVSKMKYYDNWREQPGF